MKIVPILVSCLLQIWFATSGDSQHTYTAADCIFERNSLVHFHEHDGKLKARIDLADVPPNSNEEKKYGIHIHTNSYSGGPCVGLGPHFNPSTAGHGSDDLGNIEPEGGLLIKNGGLHTDAYHVEGLSLDGQDTGIIGRSIAIHNDKGAKILCCSIDGTDDHHE